MGNNQEATKPRNGLVSVILESSTNSKKRAAALLAASLKKVYWAQAKPIADGDTDGHQDAGRGPDDRPVDRENRDTQHFG
jgi:hypothetical protein